MQERNVINGVAALFLTDMLEFITPLKWFALVAVALIVVDLRFGIEAAHRRGDTVRFSRAIRRTFNKVVDYVCWILLAGAFGKAFGAHFGVETLPALVLLVIFGIEINSCYSNYFEARGKKVKIDILKYFAKKTDIIEVEHKEKEEKENEKDK